MGDGLLVIGDVVTDVVATPDGPLAPGTDTSAHIRMRPGGSGANTAAWAAHCGARVALLAGVGADSAEWHERELSKVGVSPRLHVDPDASTAVVMALIDGEGERSMITDRGAGARLGAAQWNDDLLDGVGHLHISGYLLFAEPGWELFSSALAAARRHAVTTSIDPASTGFLVQFGIGRFLEATSDVDLVLPNLDEAVLLSGQTDPLSAAAELSRHYPSAAVTLGKAGAVLASDGQIITRAEATPSRMVDSVGAGDAFTGGFLAARLGGADMPQAVADGCRAGALAVTLVGGRPPVV